MKSPAGSLTAKVRLAALITGFFMCALPIQGCNYSRMQDDEAAQAYNDEFPRMPKKTIPVGGGVWVEREQNPVEVVNPSPKSSATIEDGAQRYKLYCIHCHGPMADGNGTVGQSFAPIPADLKAPRVRNQSDGELYYKIRFGFLRHPPLFSTLSDEETWAVVRYVRSLPDRS